MIAIVGWIGLGAGAAAAAIVGWLVWQLKKNIEGR